MVRTRFAPSPTGYLHIGGVRTALFNWLYARRHGGSFVLRIDDTDQARNVDEALRPILDGFRWLGLDWDEGPDVGGDRGPYYQSQRTERYAAAVERLIERGYAYRDYATAGELAAEREAAQAAKTRFIYSRRFMAETAAERARFEAEGRPAVVRLKMPREGECRFGDLIRGRVAFEWALEQDHVVQRADGSVLYNLANVVDDHEMGITHVIRAEEHLSNTPRQLFIAEGLGIETPDYAHVPFVAEPGSKNKLSKRKLDTYLKHQDFRKMVEHARGIAGRIGLAIDDDTFNPVIVDFYRAVGYLPEALVNYLVLLGWSLDDRTERFERRDLVERFSLDRVGKSASSFDPQKLTAFEQSRWLDTPLEERVELCVPFLARAGVLPAEPSPEARATVAQVVAAAGDRIIVAGDILGYDDFFAADDALAYDEKAVTKRLRKAGAADLLDEFLARLALVERWDAATLESEMTRFVEERGMGLGQIIHAVRVAVTGKAVGFGMFETLAILGRRRCLKRIARGLEVARSEAPARKEP